MHKTSLIYVRENNQRGRPALNVIYLDRSCTKKLFFSLTTTYRLLLVAFTALFKVDDVSNLSGRASSCFFVLLGMSTSASACILRAFCLKRGFKTGQDGCFPVQHAGFRALFGAFQPCFLYGTGDQLVHLFWLRRFLIQCASRSSHALGTTSSGFATS